ncbi:MAG TPA: sigma-70 family RNA polymerase sigma factor [Gemmatimonadales bacterium]|nr:sigma-70 family RNA polymerase sigma factor [Gemmatimonadales bacterium]
MQGRSPLRVVGPDERAASVMAEHGRALLRTANHWSLCHDDALDAYQRALEIFLRRADHVLPDTEVAWLKVVIKHEAMAIRRARSESVSGEEPDLDARPEPTARPLDDQVAGGERVSRSAEALRALKPDERRALMLKAQGYSYQEIGQHLGWTYTKVNRAITEGRRRFMKVFQAIESGEACEQYVTTIAALAAGTATSADVIEIRPHLRHCSACRATVRRLHVPAGTRVKLLLPGFLLAPVAGLPGGVKPPEELATRSDEIQIVVPQPVDAAAPAPHAVDLAGHLQLGLDLPSRGRLDRIKEEAIGLFHRTQPGDAAASAYIATSTGGGRISTIATIIGFCLSGAGAGALCVATGVVQTPGWILGPSDRAPAPRPTGAGKPKPRGPAELTASARTTEVIATPTPRPTPSPTPSRKPHRPTAAQDPSQGTEPTSHENPPISRPPPAITTEFGPESSGGSTASQPPPTTAPVTGGDEFSP